MYYTTLFFLSPLYVYDINTIRSPFFVEFLLRRGYSTLYPNVVCVRVYSNGRTAKVEQMMQGVIVLRSGAVQPRILYRMLFERGLKDQYLRCSLRARN